MMIFHLSRRCVVFAAFLLLSCSVVSRAYAGAELTVKVAPFLDALNRSPTPVLFVREYISSQEAQAIPGIASECLGQIKGIKVASAEDEKAKFTITLSATSFRAEYFMVAQATDSAGAPVAVQADHIYPYQVQRKLCPVLLQPLAERLLHPVTEPAENGEVMQTMVEGIGYVNNHYYETAFLRLYRVLMDHPHNADALYWLAQAFAQSDHPELARLHAHEFLAAVPDDPRRPTIEALLAPSENQSDR